MTPIGPALSVLLFLHPISINLTILTLPERDPPRLELCLEACGTEFGFAPVFLLVSLPDAIVTILHILLPLRRIIQLAHIPTRSRTDPHTRARGPYTDHPLVPLKALETQNTG